MLVALLLSACGKPEQPAAVTSPAPPKPVAEQRTTRAELVGAAACVDCHREQYEAWRGSHHEQAMQPASEQSVLGDFRGAKLDHFGVSTHFFRRGEEFWVETQNAQGRLEAFKIEYTFGVQPLQQYLIAFRGGRYQALTVAWDSRPKQQGGQRWFHLQPGERVAHDDPLHWTGPYYNWNSRCAECHSTGLKKNYDAANDTYATTWKDINVACEACHGPGSEHLKWASGKQAGGAPDKGLIAKVAAEVQWSRQPQAATASPVGAAAGQGALTRQLDVCGPCHSRREVLVESDRLHQLPAYHDAYSLSLPTPPVYHADGQILEEDFELGSFLQSKMHARGVVCSNCHEPHSLQLRAPGNAVCAQCHNPEVFDTRAHHHHEPSSQGAQCANCHMPETTYMVVDRRRDHSIRIPRPDLSEKLGTPNACNQCHSKRSNAWAAAQVEQWRQGSNKPVQPHFSDRLAPVDSTAWMQLAADPAAPGIARAAALERLALQPSSNALSEARQRFNDSDPLVRRAATEGFAAVEAMQRLQMLLPLAGDRSKSVRMQVAPLLASVDLETLPDDVRRRLTALFDEYVMAMRANSDVPGNLVNLGLFHASRRQVQFAETAYRSALRIDRQFIPAYLNLADLYRQWQRESDARATLDEALKLAPTSAAVHHAVGLQRVRERQYPEALRHLARSYELAPDDATYGYVYALALFDTGSQQPAIKVLKDLRSRHPEDGRIAQALSDFLARQQAGAPAR